MIGSLRGVVLHKKPGDVLLDVAGVGYEIHTTVSAFERIPESGSEALLYIVESAPMYGGGISLYGFLSLEEKEIYLNLREIPGTGSKKALEYLDKIMKSAPDFRRAVLEGDASTLVSLFGFTKKTAEKMVVALKDRLANLRLSGKEKWNAAAASTPQAEAIAALMQLGYRETEARAALERLPSEMKAQAAVPDLLKELLKTLA